MEHTEATETHATERYLLGELTPAEIDAFEEHYFDCPECTDDVRAGMLFMEGGRQLVREKAAAPVAQIAELRARRWQWPAAVAATISAIALSGAMLMRGPAGVPAMAFATSTAEVMDEARAEGGTIVITAPGVVFVPVTEPDPPHARYQLRVIGPDNEVVLTRPVSREQIREPQLLMVPEGYAPGAYAVEVSGAAETGPFKPISTEHFTVKR